jgi:hypothetical protein
VVLIVKRTPLASLSFVRAASGAKFDFLFVLFRLLSLSLFFSESVYSFACAFIFGKPPVTSSSSEPHVCPTYVCKTNSFSPSFFRYRP